MANKTNSIKTLEQGRAKFAYDYVIATKNVLTQQNQGDKKTENEKVVQKFASYVKKFPMMVKANGLGASIAFYYSKRDKEGGSYQKVLQAIIGWLKENGRYSLFGFDRLSDTKSFVEKVIELDSYHYRALTNEVLALFNWLRRFTEGLIEKD